MLKQAIVYKGSLSGILEGGVWSGSDMSGLFFRRGRRVQGTGPKTLNAVRFTASKAIGSTAAICCLLAQAGLLPLSRSWKKLS